MNNDRICVGVITGSFGVQGEARLKSFCAEPAAIGDYGSLTTEDGGREFIVKLTRPVKGGFGARLSGVKTKEQADSLKGTKLFARRADLPSLPDDEFYYTDLIGLAVFDTGGQQIGKVNAVQDHGAGDILEISGPQIDGTMMLLFTLDTVPTVDLKAGRIVVDPPNEVNAKDADD